MDNGSGSSELWHQGPPVMPNYVFDTNMCIYLMKNHREELARRVAQ